jgi:primosomal replication protein N
LERPYFGIRFTENDKKNLLTTGNLGRVVEAEYKPGEKTPVLLSLDKQTNELVAFRKEWIKIPETYKGVQLNEEQKYKLGMGEKVEIKGMTSTKGKPFDGAVQFNADKRYFELIFNNNKNQSQNQSKKQDIQYSETQNIRISKNIMGFELTEKQQNLLKDGKTIYVSGMKDREGQDFNAYIKVNTEKNKLDFFKFNPDKAKKQGAEITPDNAHKTQVAKNNDGKTTEATKNVSEPLKSRQTQPTEKQAEKQEKKKTGKKIS